MRMKSIHGFLNTKKIYSDKEFYKTEFGRKMLRANLGSPEEPIKENTDKDSFAKNWTLRKKRIYELLHI